VERVRIAKLTRMLLFMLNSSSRKMRRSRA
jgi:hypothetical protein